jgi:acetolactate synthase-1/2/3 large subunit
MGLPEEIGSWTELPDTDFAAVARGMGLEGERVTDPADLAAAVRRALQSETSYLIDVITDAETRMKRAIPGVIPILSDRPGETTESIEGARRDPHYNLTLRGAWPQPQ